jgi:hypothetical protein
MAAWNAYHHYFDTHASGRGIATALLEGCPEAIGPATGCANSIKNVGGSREQARQVRQ